MAHELIAIIVKAQNENEAREKAQDVRDNLCICGVRSHWGGFYDWGVVVDGDQGYDPSQGWWYTNRWIPARKSHPLYEILNKSRRISRLDSEYAQVFIESRYEPAVNDEHPDDYKKGYFVRDEEGEYILQNDGRLHDKDYFVVPLDMHS